MTCYWWILPPFLCLPDALLSYVCCVGIAPQSASDAFDLGYTVAQYIYDNLDRVVYGQQSPPRW